MHGSLEGHALRQRPLVVVDDQGLRGCNGGQGHSRSYLCQIQCTADAAFDVDDCLARNILNAEVE